MTFITWPTDGLSWKVIPASLHSCWRIWEFLMSRWIIKKNIVLAGIIFDHWCFCFEIISMLKILHALTTVVYIRYLQMDLDTCLRTTKLDKAYNGLTWACCHHFSPGWRNLRPPSRETCWGRRRLRLHFPLPMDWG